MSPVDLARPVVTVGHPTFALDAGDPEVAMEGLVLTCSACGELTDWESLTRRGHLQYLARQHAHEAHDGDVDAQGWVR